MPGQILINRKLYLNSDKDSKETDPLDETRIWEEIINFLYLEGFKETEVIKNSKHIKSDSFFYKERVNNMRFNVKFTKDKKRVSFDIDDGEKIHPVIDSFLIKNVSDLSFLFFGTTKYYLFASNSTPQQS